MVRDDCLLTREQVTLYQATARAMLDEVAGITDTGRRRMHVFAGIARLKQICNHPASLVEGDESDLAGRSGKLDRLVDLIEEIAAEDEAVVVFSQYATFLRRMAPYLTERLGLDVPVLHGGLARGQRDEIVDRFGRGRGAGVLAVSLRAGGTGLNLVRANHVVHFDRWWNPAVEDQASDRVWRIGQTRGVVVHTLVCPGTIEERIAGIIESKRALAGSIITSTEQLITALDDDELAAFVHLDADRRVAGGAVSPDEPPVVFDPERQAELAEVLERLERRTRLDRAEVLARATRTLPPPASVQRALEDDDAGITPAAPDAPAADPPAGSVTDDPAAAGPVA